MKKCKYCQEEINGKAKVCPKCGQKQKSKKWLIILGVVVLIGIIIGGSSGSETEEKTGTTTTKEKFTLLEGYNGYVGEYDFGYYIEGYIQNNTDKEYSYVQVEFNLYDKDGALIDTALDNINNLEANGKWKFKATSLVDDPSKVASYKLKEITGW